MNERFYNLPIEKQQSIINAGFRVFAQNTYKKSPMSEIADAAGISKSLLFHYFHNKKELYLFLWEQGAKITVEELQKSGCYQEKDFFDSMYKGMQAKLQIMRQYPELGRFVIKAYYEKDPAVCQDIQNSIAKYAAMRSEKKLLYINPQEIENQRFVEGIDFEMMYKDMYWASEGYLWEKMQHGEIDVDSMEKDFSRLIEFWKSIYLRKEE